MPKLPIVNGRDIVKILVHVGYSFDRQKGSHLIMIKKGCRSIPVPNHRPVSCRTVEAIIKQSGMTKENFIKMYKDFL